MRKNKNSRKIAAFVCTCFLLQGCSPNEKELWGLGSFVFLAFVTILILNSIVPRIQEVPKLKAVVTKIEVISAKVWPLVLLIAIAFILCGAYSLAANENRTREDILIFVGVTILYAAVNLKRWSGSEDMLKKRNYLRAIGISLSFLMIFVYLLLGAPNLRL